MIVLQKEFPINSSADGTLISLQGNELCDKKGPGVHVSLIFQTEAFEEVIQEYTTELEGAFSNRVFRPPAPEASALWMFQAGGKIFLGHANDVVA